MSMFSHRSLLRGIAATARGAHGLVSRTQTGQLRWYAANMAAGLLLVVAIVVTLT